MYSKNMSDKSLDEALNELSLIDQSNKPTGSDREPITIWVTKECKNKYDITQNLTSKKFGKKLREIVMIAIDKTAAKISA